MERLTQSEEDALSALWSTNPGFVKDVLDKLSHPVPPYTTLASTLRNLERKHYVSTEKLGNSFRYTALISAEDYKRYSLGLLVREHFHDSYKELVFFIAKEQDITQADLLELIQVIKHR
jgi:BlaI family penicillinase repressor